MTDTEPSLESLEAASLVAFHGWRARYPNMDLPDGASLIFLSGFAAGALHGAKLAAALEEKR